MFTHRRRLFLFTSVVGLTACGVVSVERTGWEWLPASNLKPADSTCERVVANGRAIHERFYLYVRLGVQSPNEPLRVFQRTALQEMLPYFQLPDTLAGDFAWTPDPASWRLRPSRTDPPDLAPRRARHAAPGFEKPPTGGELDAMVSFDVGRSGNIESARVSFPSQVRGFSDSLLTMVQKAGMARAIPPIPEQLPAPLHFDVRLSVIEWVDTSAVAIDTVRVRFPYYTRTSAVKRMRAVRYPPNAPGIGIHDTVMVSFVVDTTGLVRSGSLRVLYANHLAFAQEAARVMDDAVFQAAEYRGCPIAAHTHLPFIFPGR